MISPKKLAAIGTLLVVVGPSLYSLLKGEEVRIELSPLHKEGIITLRAGDVKQSFVDPLVIIKGRCELDSVSACDQYGKKAPLKIERNNIHLKYRIGPDDHIDIYYSFKKPSKIDEIRIEVGEKIWGLESQRKRDKRIVLIISAIPWIILAVVFLCWISCLNTKTRAEKPFSKSIQPLITSNIVHEITHIFDVLLSKCSELEEENGKENLTVLLKRIINGISGFDNNQR